MSGRAAREDGTTGDEERHEIIEIEREKVTEKGTRGCR